MQEERCHMWSSIDHHQYYNSSTVITKRLPNIQEANIKYWTYMRCGCDEGNFPNSSLNSRRHYNIIFVCLLLINVCNSYHTREIKYWYVYSMEGRSYSSFLSLCTTSRFTCVIRNRYIRSVSFQKKSAEGFTHSSKILLLPNSFRTKVVLFTSSCHKLRIIRRPGLVSRKSDK